MLRYWIAGDGIDDATELWLDGTGPIARAQAVHLMMIVHDSYGVDNVPLLVSDESGNDVDDEVESVYAEALGRLIAASAGWN